MYLKEILINLQTLPHNAIENRFLEIFANVLSYLHNDFIGVQLRKIKLIGIDLERLTPVYIRSHS
jgi:hypothetical protein